MAVSLHPREMADSFRYLFKLAISALAFYQSEERDLQDFSSSSRDLMRFKEFALSWIIFSLCSMLLKL